jgi:hypothetical protein
MRNLLPLFVVLEVPVLFLFAASVIFLRRRLPDHWLPRLMAFQFPVIAAGGVGLPLWTLWQVLQLH